MLEAAFFGWMMLFIGLLVGGVGAAGVSDGSRSGWVFVALGFGLVGIGPWGSSEIAFDSAVEQTRCEMSGLYWYKEGVMIDGERVRCLATPPEPGTPTESAVKNPATTEV